MKQQKEPNALSGCAGAIVGSFAVLLLILYLLQDTGSNVFPVNQLVKTAARIFVGIAFWAVLLFFVGGSRR